MLYSSCLAQGRIGDLGAPTSNPRFLWTKTPFKFVLLLFIPPKLQYPKLELHVCI
jgi:hypothetical protein